jgi:topoisomerase-4 subunit A
VESTEKKIDFLGDEDKNRLLMISRDSYPLLEILYDMKLKTKGVEKEEISVHEFVGVKSVKAKGKRLTIHPMKKLGFLEPLKITAPVPQDEESLTEPEAKEIIEEKNATAGNNVPEDNKEDLPGAVQMELPL